MPSLESVPGRLASPRFRRRVLRGLIALGVAGAIAVGVVLIGEKSGKVRQTFDNRPVQVYRQPKSVPLKRADRRRIETLLDGFVAAGVERQNPALAWQLSTPALRRTATKADWLKGELPVMPYKARGSLHGFYVQWSYKNDVGLDLSLLPAPNETNPGIVFNVEVKKLGGRWLVDSIVPAATMGGTQVHSQADLAPQTVVPAPPKGRVGTTYVWAFLAVLGVAVLAVPTVFVIRSSRR
jgi:hypothetical protein